MSYGVNDVSKGGGLTRQTLVGETFQAYELGCLNDVGVWVPSDATDESLMPALALSVSTVYAGTIGTFLLIGVVNNNEWRWNPGALLYASRTPGRITETRPDVTGDQVQFIGRALSSTLIIFVPSYVVIEVQEVE